MTPADLHKLYAAVIGLLLLVGGFLWWRYDIGQKAVIAYVTHGADSTLKVAQDSSAKALRDTVAASKRVQASKDSLTRQTALLKAQRAKSDSVTKVEASARQRAEQALADSLAGTVTLRTSLAGLIVASRQDSIAHEAERVQDTADHRAFVSAITADSAQHQTDVHALSLMEGRAQAAERLAALLKKSQPGFIGKYAGWAVASVVTVAAILKK